MVTNQIEREITMTQEEKDLLLKDLCARLPYGVAVVLDEKFGFNKAIRTLVKELLDLYCVEGMKPYLRPMSSMTEEELHEVQEILGKDVEIREVFILIVDSSINSFSYLELIAVFDWLNAHHFDYRGLIEKGLAVKVTAENNPYK